MIISSFQRDTEGKDFEVLQSLNLERYDPKYICIEIYSNDDLNFDIKKDQVYNYLVKKNYILLINKRENYIFKKKFWLLSILQVIIPNNYDSNFLFSATNIKTLLLRCNRQCFNKLVDRF